MLVFGGLEVRNSEASKYLPKNRRKPPEKISSELTFPKQKTLEVPERLRELGFVGPTPSQYMSHVVNYRGIVSRFEVTFKHGFEGFTSKTIGGSLNNDTPETYM